MRVEAFTKYSRMAASTRQRLLQYEPALAAAGITLEHHALLGDSYVQSLATGGGFSRLEVARSYLSRLRQIVRSDADVIWVYAELFPYLPGLFERLAKRTAKPIVYDFDDAFFEMYDSNARPAVRRLLGGKLEPLLGSASACCCGNAYLQSYALRFCPNSIVLPTVVDTSRYLPGPPATATGPVTLGWIGTPSTWAYVRPLLPMLRELVDGSKVRFRVVGAGRAAEADIFPGLDLIDWSEDGEIGEVQAMDIGIMPLPDEPWARGKSGYKLIQYMACGLPVIASPVGVNSEIVRDGENGILASDPGEWRSALARLIADPGLRSRFGHAGRLRSEREYSLAATAPRLVELFRSLGRPQR